jgi:xanthine dehydrogenase small subunit
MLIHMNTPPSSQTLRFLRRGEVVTLHDVPSARTLLQVLREDLHCTATKEGCSEGDCGACTVVVAAPSAQGDGTLRYQAVNSCIRLAHSVDGMALWTAADLSPALHPVQQAMVDCHASQCGFCTPGFVMSLFALYQNHTAKGEALSREAAAQALSGNLCRCTGYRPIVDAAQAMQSLPLPSHMAVDEPALLSKLALHSHTAPAQTPHAAYLSPTTLAELLAARARWPLAQLVAGCTDVGLWVTKQHRQLEQVLDVTRVAELRRVEHYPHHIAIGAAVTLTDAFAALVAERPQLAEFAHRFAALPVRNSGTLGGNVANGSPIGDSMPLLIALGASVVLMSQRGHRELALEDLYTGYRQNVMAPDEVLAWIKVPKATAGEWAAVYKISKRQEDDISAVCLALRLQQEGGVVRSASMGVGGMAATPVRARQTEAALQGQPWTQATVARAADTLRNEFAPLSDMRASADYRRTVLGNLLQRVWLESQGTSTTRLQTLQPIEAASAARAGATP